MICKVLLTEHFCAVCGGFMPRAFVIILTDKHEREVTATYALSLDCSDPVVTKHTLMPVDNLLCSLFESPLQLPLYIAVGISSPHTAQWKRHSLAATIPAPALSQFHLQSTVCISVEPRRIPVPCPSTLGFLGSTTEKATNQYRGSFPALAYSASPKNEAFFL